MPLTKDGAMGLKNEVLQLVALLIGGVLLGLFASNALPDIVLRGLEKSSTIYSAKLGGVGLVYFLIGLPYGVGLSARALFELTCFRTKVTWEKLVLNFAVVQLMIFIGAALTFWYGWSWLAPIAK